VINAIEVVRGSKKGSADDEVIVNGVPLWHQLYRGWVFFIHLPDPRLAVPRIEVAMIAGFQNGIEEKVIAEDIAASKPVILIAAHA